MKNILSYEDYTEFTGKEIKEWIKYQIDNQTKHMKKAKKLSQFDIVDDQKYMICDLRSKNVLFLCKNKDGVKNIKHPTKN